MSAAWCIRFADLEGVQDGAARGHQLPGAGLPCPHPKHCYLQTCKPTSSQRTIPDGLEGCQPLLAHGPDFVAMSKAAQGVFQASRRQLHTIAHCRTLGCPESTTQTVQLSVKAHAGIPWVFCSERASPLLITHLPTQAYGRHLAGQCQPTG